MALPGAKDLRPWDLDPLGTGCRTGSGIRSALMDAKLPHMHRLAKFVGAKAYEEAAVQ